MMIPPIRGSLPAISLNEINQRLKSYFSLSRIQDSMESLAPTTPRGKAAFSMIKQGIQAFVKVIVTLHDALFTHFKLNLPSKQWSALATSLIQTCNQKRVNNREFVAGDLIEYGELNPEFFQKVMNQFFIELEKVGKHSHRIQEIAIREFVENYLVYKTYNLSVFLGVVKTYC